MNIRFILIHYGHHTGHSIIKYAACTGNWWNQYGHVYNGSILCNYNFRATWRLQVFWLGVFAHSIDSTPIQG